MGEVWHGGKGSKRRQSQVDAETVRMNYNRIFRKDIYQRQMKQKQQRQKKQLQKQQKTEQTQK